VASPAATPRPPADTRESLAARSLNLHDKTLAEVEGPDRVYSRDDCEKKKSD
jgi:hypothetical protein